MPRWEMGEGDHKGWTRQVCHLIQRQLKTRGRDYQINNEKKNPCLKDMRVLLKRAHDMLSSLGEKRYSLSLFVRFLRPRIKRRK